MPNRRNDGRPVVGPADPATRRAALAKYESEAHNEAVSRMAKPVAATPTARSVAQEQGIVNKNGRINTRRERINQVVDGEG